MNIKSVIKEDSNLLKWLKYAFHRWPATSDIGTDDSDSMIDILKTKFGFSDDLILRFANATHTLNQMSF